MFGSYDDEIKFPRFWMVAVFWENRYFGGAGEATEWVSVGGGFAIKYRYLSLVYINIEQRTKRNNTTKANVVTILINKDYVKIAVVA